MFTVLLVIFSLAFIWYSTVIPDPPRNVAVGPRTFPFILGGLLLACSSFLAFKQVSQVFSGRVDDPAVEESVPVEDDAEIGDWSGVFVTLGAFLVLLLVLEWLGFLLSFTCFIFFLSTYFVPKKWKVNLLVAPVFATTFYLMFTKLLGVILPNGLLSSII
ncbi:tripartite tricarboxylate transporter TctB family protein [Agaricicola taiwanensis]|uniref:tripartite tricarboxylate transporter TctB family protein n=1 Tax=Agaricicola taiwanensis TaxID=591372 RepID=UPI001E354934|nr:tripartite tricarboxylate transporter TctB family protein [Agaricicola taiwanensis]